MGVSVATRLITNAPSVAASLANRSGVSSYFTSTSKDNYDCYYKRIVSEGVLYDVVLDILATFADKGYSVCQDPRHHISEKIADISADILCFRNSTSFYDYSSYGTTRVRVFYNDNHVTIMCKKKAQLDDFVHRFSNDFKPESLVFIGIG